MEIVTLVLLIFGAVLLQNFIFNRYVFHKLNYRCQFSSQEAHEGDHIFLVETVENRKLLPVPWLKVDIHSSVWLDFAKTSSVVAQETRRVTSCFFLKSRQKTVRQWKLQCLKRGVFNTENVTLVSGDLLGLRRNSVAVKVEANLVVYPEIIDLDDLFVPARQLQGDAIVKRWIIEDPFIISGTREYFPSDPMNRIHWPSSAKVGEWRVRKNDFTSQMSMDVILNVQSMEFEYGGAVYKDRIELGIKAAATLLDRALRDGIPARLSVNESVSELDEKTTVTGLSAGKDHVSDLLNILARLRMKSGMEFGGFLREVQPQVENSDVFIITGYVSQDLQESVQALRTRGNQVKVILLDKDLDPYGEYGMLDVYFPVGEVALHG